MKKFNRSTAIILSVIMFFALAIGFVLSFVKIDFKKSTFVSLSKTVNISTDLTGGLYGEYAIATENPSEADLIQTVSTIREVFEEDGYKNVNVYAVGNKKVRVEVSYPNGGMSFSDAYSKLANVASGAFSLRSDYELKDTSIVVSGADYVKSVSVFTNDSAKYIKISFTKAGQEAYKKLCMGSDGTGASQIYMVLGDYSQSISISGVQDFSALTLSNTDYNNMIALEQKIKLGCAKVQFDASNVSINTMSATLTHGESASTPLLQSYKSSTALVVCVSAFLLVAVLLVAFFAIKFGFFAIPVLVSMLVNVYLYLIIVCLIPSFELGLSVVLTLTVGLALIYGYVYEFARNVKSEYELGKSFAAALESSYKKSLLNIVITNLVLFAASLSLMAFAFSEISSVAVTFAIVSILSLVTSLGIIPLIVKIWISLDKAPRRLFMLKKRAGISIGEDEETQKEGK